MRAKSLRCVSWVLILVGFIAACAPAAASVWRESTQSLGAPDDPNDASTPEDDVDLLTWASDSRRGIPATPTHCTDCFLVVGVKTRAVRGFQARQLIRASWANPIITRSLRTRVVFLGCSPNVSQEADPNATLRALEQEKQASDDLLTHELGCVDAYAHLVDKTLGFFHWASVKYPLTAFLMLADDDVYVRLDRVVAILQHPLTPRHRYYAGQVSSVRLRRLVPTIRDAWHKNVLSVDEYPLSEHVPRAIGAHFLLSIDLVHFLARNHLALRGVGTIEDLSVGFWLRSLLRVVPVHLSAFETTLCGICRNELASFGDLSPYAMRQIHENLRHGDAFCRGYVWRAWAPLVVRDPPRTKQTPLSGVAYAWTIMIEERTRGLRIDVALTLAGSPLPALSYRPWLESYEEFCQKVDEVVDEPALCEDLLDRLDDFLAASPTSNTALLALARSNLPPLAGLFVMINVWISTRALRWRVFVECLFAEVYPDLRVYVVDESTDPDPTIVVTPDFAVISAEDLESIPNVPESCRVLVIAETVAHPALQGFSREGTIVVTLDRTSVDTQLYVPLLSLVFSDSVVYSPLELLESSDARRPENRAVSTFGASHCTAKASTFLSLLEATPCFPEADDKNDFEDSEELFAFDAQVEKYAQSKFVLVLDSDKGQSGATIVAAFLAGSVPIYVGNNPTVAALFNPNALIYCGHFASLDKCARVVIEVHHSPTQYAAMRKERPVVNTTAFEEVFSWHPDVLHWRQDTSQKSMAARLEQLITKT